MGTELGLVITQHKGVENARVGSFPVGKAAGLTEVVQRKEVRRASSLTARESGG